MDRRRSQTGVGKSSMSQGQTEPNAIACRCRWQRESLERPQPLEMKGQVPMAHTRKVRSEYLSTSLRMFLKKKTPKKTYAAGRGDENEWEEEPSICFWPPSFPSLLHPSLSYFSQSRSSIHYTPHTTLPLPPPPPPLFFLSHFPSACACACVRACAVRNWEVA